MDNETKRTYDKHAKRILSNKRILRTSCNGSWMSYGQDNRPDCLLHGRRYQDQ